VQISNLIFSDRSWDVAMATNFGNKSAGEIGLPTFIHRISASKRLEDHNAGFKRLNATFDISHAFLPLTVAKLSTPKTVRFFGPLSI